MVPKMVVTVLLLAIALSATAVPINHFPLATASSNPPLTQGDMALTPDQLRNGMIDPRFRWPGGIIPYELDPTFTLEERNTVFAAMSDIHSRSCVRFQQRSNQGDYVFIQRGGPNSGCWAYVGRIGGRQIVNLEAPGCVRATGPGPHELMHAIGFHHEHSRQDRDDYVRIMWQNIDPGKMRQLRESKLIPIPLVAQYPNFDKSTGTTTLNFPYDYLSIMQYPRWGFSNNGQDAIQPIPNNDVPFGPYEYLSVDDGRKINAMYAGIC